MTPDKTVQGLNRLDVVLPAFNEEANLQQVVSHLLSAPWPKELSVFAIIVDDGSTDGTLRVAQSLVAGCDHVHVVHHDRNEGYGAALADGIAHATGNYVAIMDADGQFAAGDLIHLYEFIHSHDIVVGYRTRRADPAVRRFLGRMGSALGRLLFRTRLRDLNCGLKVFRRSLLKDIPLRCHGPGINLEIFALLAWQDLKVKEVPVGHFPRAAGTQTGGQLRTLTRLLPESLSVLWRSMF